MPIGDRYIYLLTSVLLAAPFTSQADESVNQVKNWFMMEFAPIWQDMDRADPSKIKEFWAEDFRDHPIDLDSSIWENSEEQWERNIARNKSDGLKGSEVTKIEVEKISGRAFLIRAEWSDYDEAGRLEEPYCGAYIVGKFGKGWKFTNYITIECSDR